ncbi:hypothetical protein ACRJ4W_27915 [Streptomyces sp. GLT-R25]
MPPTFVLGVYQQSGEEANGAVGAGRMSGAGRRDPVSMVGSALALLTENRGSAVGRGSVGHVGERIVRAGSTTAADQDE